MVGFRNNVDNSKRQLLRFLSLTHCEEEDRSDASKDCPNYRALKDFTVPNRPVELFVYPPDPRRIQELTNEIIEASQERDDSGVSKILKTYMWFQILVLNRIQFWNLVKVTSNAEMLLTLALLMFQIEIVLMSLILESLVLKDLPVILDHVDVMVSLVYPVVTERPEAQGLQV